MVKAVVASARAGQKTVRRPYLGATLQTVASDVADGLGLSQATGALVAAIREGSPAEQGGLKRGDVVTAVDGRPVEDPDGFGWLYALKGVTGTTPVTVNRGGKPVTLTLRLEPAPERPARDLVALKGRSPFAGATIVNASPAVAEELQLAATEGVVVSEVEEGSSAARVGLQKGDLLLAINGETMRATADVARAARNGASYWRITIGRGGQVMTSVLGG